MTNPKWLKLAAQRSARYSWTLGHVFARYQESEGLSAEALAAELGCSPAVLEGLSLCRRPDEERFAEHLRIIAKRFEVDPRRLAAVLRRVEVLDALVASPDAGEPVREDSLLLAARDPSIKDDDETNS
ncbi:hypothetical protein F0U61_42620 [Archangium violaceum]|uniref:hypothetical protein n=1 Tax=Archangium violaceum TaxID=83451 RepID=UPI002B29805F|nr:hypothetical protein F0U61_42620 [Archangium violaceum]